MLDSSNLPKFQLELSKFLSDSLEKEILKLEIISNLPSNVANSGGNPDFRIVQEKKDEKLEEKFHRTVQSLKKLQKDLKRSQIFDFLIYETDLVIGNSKKALDMLEKLKVLETVKSHLQKAPKVQKQTLKTWENKITDDVWKQKIEKCQKAENLSNQMRFNTDWIDSQLNQQKILIQKSLNKADTEIIKTAVDQAVTTDACMNISHFYVVKIAELKASTEKMENEYENYAETIETDYQKAVGDKRQLLGAIESDKQFYMKRQEEIENYVSEKRRKAAEKELLQLHETNAIVIQAWWRGILVRKYLGPFKAFKKRAKQIRKEFRERRKAKKGGKSGRK